MIRRITIRNFRSLADVTVELDPVTVLIGKSGTGKSNFVRAIRFLRDVIASRNPPGTNDWLGSAHLMNQDQPVSFIVQFSAPGWDDETFQYELAVTQSAVMLEQMTVNGKTIFSRRQGKWEHAPDIAPQSPPRGVLLGMLNGIPEVTAAFTALTRGIGCYDFPGNVLQPTNTSAQGNSSRGLGDTGANYLAVVGDIISDFQQPRSWKQLTEPLAKLNPTVVAVTLHQPEQNQLIVTYKIGGQWVLFDVAQESEGFRRFLAQLLALYQSPPKQSLLFEHPENGIHPGALETLFEQFMACPQEGRGQVILTTHSPQLLDCFDPTAIRVVEIHDQKTRIGRLDAEQIEVIKDQLMQPGQLLTVDEPRIEESAEVQ